MTTGPALIVESQTLPIRRTISVVGRRDRESGFVPELDVGELDPGRAVSRRHAELTVRDGQVYLRDLGSANGSSINGVGLAKDKTYSLRDGDIVSFGNLSTQYRRHQSWPDAVVAEWLGDDASGEPLSDAPPILGAPPVPVVPPTPDVVDESIRQPSGAVFCQQCGKQASPGAASCGGCGAVLGGRR